MVNELLDLNNETDVNYLEMILIIHLIIWKYLNYLKNETIIKLVWIVEIELSIVWILDSLYRMTSRCLITQHNGDIKCRYQNCGTSQGV